MDVMLQQLLCLQQPAYAFKVIVQTTISAVNSILPIQLSQQGPCCKAMQRQWMTMQRPWLMLTLTANTCVQGCRHVAGALHN
jgi:hypothetical protein